jgi:hypothetical protein
MEYHIRPVDTKHSILLPVGQEAVFRIKKGRLYLSIPDGDRKARPFHIVAMQPMNLDSESAASSHRGSDKPVESRRPMQPPPPVKPGNADNATVQNPGPGH